jgi:hypothetical protein
MEIEPTAKRNPELVLEDLEKRLREIPSYKLMDRKLLQVKIDILKKRIREQDLPQLIPELPQDSLEEEKDANSVGAATHGLFEVQEPEGIGRLPEPLRLGLPGNANAEAERAENAGRSLPVESGKPEIEEGLGRVHESLGNADHKAMFFLSVVIAVIAFLLAHNAFGGWFNVAEWSFVDLIGLVSVIGLAVAAAMMLAVLYKGLNDSRFLTPAELSMMCMSKYRHLVYGFWIGVGSAFTSLLFLILSKKPHPVHF